MRNTFEKQHSKHVLIFSTCQYHCHVGCGGIWVWLVCRQTHPPCSAGHPWLPRSLSAPPPSETRNGWWTQGHISLKSRREKSEHGGHQREWYVLLGWMKSCFPSFFCGQKGWRDARDKALRHLNERGITTNKHWSVQPNSFHKPTVFLSWLGSVLVQRQKVMTFWAPTAA